MAVLKTGFIDNRGNIVIQPKFEMAGDFHEGLALVIFQGKVGFIDKTGCFVIEPKFDQKYDQSSPSYTFFKKDWQM